LAVRFPRFFAPAAAAAATTIDLPEDEANHLTRVLRLGPGDRVAVFNGSGGEWHASVETASKKQVSVRLIEAVKPAPEPDIAITLAVAMLKGDRMGDLIRDAVMLGVAAIQPIITGRTEAPLSSRAESSRLARWTRIAVSSTKQCGRAVVAPVHPPLTFDVALESGETPIMFVEPDTAWQARSLRAVPRASASTVFIGPEGGWTADEVRLASARGAMLVTLGAQTIRADAMPVVALTALRVHWGDL
jgi:16S rRNA (uracil1498-N3)-methyltransferase